MPGLFCLEPSNFFNTHLSETARVENCGGQPTQLIVPVYNIKKMLIVFIMSTNTKYCIL